MGRLDGKVAIVTGAALGQGAAHTALLAREGAKVLATDVLDEKGREVANALVDEGLNAAYEPLDVTSNTDWERAVRATVDRFGPPSVLINNAGVTARTALVDCTDHEWDRTVAVNQTGIFYGMRAVIPLMVEAGSGSVINIASVWSHTGGHTGYFAYVATKTAVIGMTKNAAINYGQLGVRVAEISIRYDQGPPSYGVSILEFRGDKIARESIYVTEGWDPPEWRAPVEIRAIATPSGGAGGKSGAPPARVAAPRAVRGIVHPQRLEVSGSQLCHDPNHARRRALEEGTCQDALFPRGRSR